MDGNRAERGGGRRGNASELLLALLMLSGCSSPTNPPSPTVKVVPSEPDVVASPSPTVASAVAKPVTRKRSAESLRDRIRITVERMQADAPARKQRQSLSRIAKALLEYEQQQGHLPAEEGDSSTNLSWRVHLLPFLGEAALHREFHLDEPWDSSHNMVLVSRMPRVYGDDALGLTRWHRLSQQSPTSSMLVVEASDDAADFWTRPGGLVDDATTIPVRFALRDGTLYSVTSNVTAAEWQVWRQSSQGLHEVPAWLERIALPSDVQAMVNDAASTVDRSAREPWPIPTDAWCAISLEPRRLLSHPLRAELLQALTADVTASQSPHPLQTMLGSYGSSLRSACLWLDKHHLPLDRMESLTVVVPATLVSGPVNATESFAIVCRAAGVFDVEAMIAGEMESSDGFQYREQAATSGIVDLKQSLALHFAKDDTLLLGGQSLILNLSEAPPEESLLTSWLRQTGTAPIVIVMNAEPIQSLFKQPPVFASPLQELLPFIMDARGFIFACDPDADPLATMTIPFRQTSSPVGLQALLMNQMEVHRDALVKRKPSTGDDFANAWLMALIDGLQIEVDGDALRITLTRPKNFEALLQSLLKVAEEKK